MWGSVRRRRGRPVFAGAVGVLVAAMLGVWALDGVRRHAASRGAYPELSGRLAVRGLEGPVAIDRDERGIPHVSAEREADGWRGLGFVHAQDRLGQMLWLRLLAQGRSAEVRGEAGVEADTRARVVDFAGLAQLQLPRLSDATQSVLTRYSEGINARIDRIHAGEVRAPLSVTRGGVPLEPWRPEDSLAIFKLYAWTLGQSVEASLLLQDVIQLVGATGALPFFPGGRVSDAPSPARKTAQLEPPPGSDLPLRSPLRAALGWVGPSVGSSAFVIGGQHTENGLPILVADAHLGTTAPPMLHVDRLRAGDLDIAGATLPGVPVFWIGRNRQVAWAAVNAPVVVTDLYAEILDPSRGTRYHDGKRWRDLSLRNETLKVAGADPVSLEIRSTRHGPLLPETLESQPLAVSWVGARVEGPSGIGSLLGVAQAGSGAEVLGALAEHHEPALLVTYADAEGTAGRKLAGWVPDRSLSAQLMPLPGRARWYDWSKRVPYPVMPAATLEAGKGWLVAADHAHAPSDTSHSIDWMWRSGRRAERIDRLIADAVQRSPVDLRGMARLQADVFDERATALVRDVVSLMRHEDAEPLPPEAEELIEILADWDGRVSALSVGATAYHVFAQRLTSALLSERLSEALLRRYVGLSQADPERLAHELVREAVRAQGRGSERRWRPVAGIIGESLREAWLRLSYGLGANRQRWTWGRLHPLRFQPFGGLVGVLDPGVGLGAIPYGGNGHTVNAGGFDPLDAFEVRVGSTLRFAVDTAALDQGLVALAPGQSEHPGHRHFDDGLAPWLAGEGSLLASGRLLVEESSVARLLLEPVR